jgi:glutathione S-transferase
MSKLKLVYFDTKGIAETSRLILKISGVKFEDIRYAIDFDKQNKSSDFERDKKLGLFDKSLGKLPFLEIINNGAVEILSQPSSIERYLAKKYDLMGKTLLEEAKIDSVCEYIENIREHYRGITHYQKLKTDTDKHNYFTEHVKQELENLVRILESENMPYAIGNKLSLADICIYTLITVDFNDHKDIIYSIAGRIKKIRNIVVRVSNIPEVREWTKMYPV